MSLARTALRLAVIEALRSDPVIAAYCGSRIRDSAIPVIDSRDPVSTITIYTEEDAGQAFSTNNGGPPFDETCELLIEIAMRCVVQVTEGDDPLPFVAVTDAELEAQLDLLEHRAVDAVTVAETAEAALVRQVTRRITAFKSIRFASDQSADKAALRMVHLTVDLKGDDGLDGGTGPFASLPDPLRTVAEALPAGSSGFAVCTALAAAFSGAAPDPAPLMTGVDITLAPTGAIDPALPPTAEPPADVFVVRATTL